MLTGRKNPNDPSGILLEEFNKFAPKLNFAEQCAIVVLHHKHRISVTILAIAFDIHKRTVSVMCDLEHKRYPNVKRKYHEIGMDGMEQTYLQEFHKQRVRDVQDRFKVESTPMGMPSKAHSTKKGQHIYGTTTVEIKWLEAWGKLGWWVSDDSGTTWTGDDEGNPFMSSNAAHAWCIPTFGVEV